MYYSSSSSSASSLSITWLHSHQQYIPHHHHHHHHHRPVSSICFKLRLRSLYILVALDFYGGIYGHPSLVLLVVYVEKSKGPSGVVLSGNWALQTISIIAPALTGQLSTYFSLTCYKSILTSEPMSVFSFGVLILLNWSCYLYIACIGGHLLRRNLYISMFHIWKQYLCLQWYVVPVFSIECSGAFLV